MQYTHKFDAKHVPRWLALRATELDIQAKWLVLPPCSTRHSVTNSLPVSFTERKQRKTLLWFSTSGTYYNRRQQCNQKSDISKRATNVMPPPQLLCTKECGCCPTLQLRYFQGTWKRQFGIRTFKNNGYTLTSEEPLLQRLCFFSVAQHLEGLV